LERAGVSRSVAMGLVGMKTQSNRRLGELEAGTYVGVQMNRTTLGECLALVETD
jgi:hypothetical protein